MFPVCLGQSGDCFVKDNILAFPGKKIDVVEYNNIDTRALTPEIVKEYKDTIMQVYIMQDKLTEVEDWITAYKMVLQFNYLLLNYIEEMEEK